ncbi:MAG: 2-amino-4-hydroxy-6-hydroxymethyldihydropteridine diphosphokinase [Flavobacteriales bacterium]|nr:2-amino-4-hydroxy-6-hydroxymethyldihydropteridine diphosphokinase [Flavobacteriales bacterium]
MKRTIYIALGSNLGERETNLHLAYQLIEERIAPIGQKSSIYQTEPWGYDSDEIFCNSVVSLQSSMEVNQLLEELKLIEKEMGRKSKKGNAYEDRLIDLDIIDFGGEVLQSSNLEIPHPRMHLRSFVLDPLFEIAPEWIHPSLKVPVSKLREKLVEVGLEKN